MGIELPSEKISNPSTTNVVGLYECISSAAAQNVKDSTLNDLDCQIKYYKKERKEFFLLSYDVIQPKLKRYCF